MLLSGFWSFVELTFSVMPNGTGSENVSYRADFGLNCRLMIKRNATRIRIV